LVYNMSDFTTPISGYVAEQAITISPDDDLTIEQVVLVARFGYTVVLADEAERRITASRKYLEKKLESGKIIYGINTGFGALANVAIDNENLTRLQKNIVRSHAVGVGDYLQAEIVRAMMFLTACSLCRGFSGVRIEVAKILIDFLNHNITPCVPEQGSLGASGDLAPLAHMALCLIGEGKVTFHNNVQSSSDVLKQLNIVPLELQAKEGLALMNGTHLMAAIGSILAYDAKLLLKHADIAAALSGDVMNSTVKHTTDLLHKVRPHDGQNKSACNIRKLLAGSEILESHKNCNKVQDAYSIRCVPQVHGASIDVVNYFLKTISIEINSVTDNPLIFPEDDEVISGGNFHGQPLALSADFLSIALAEIANISERRVARLVDKSLSIILPHFLVAKSGINSGLMIAQYTAASLVSENKVLAHPASTDSISSSANQEDHVSMGAHAMRKCRKILENVTNVLAIELLCGVQSLDFRRPLKSSEALESIFQMIREKVDFIEVDRYMAPDIGFIKGLIKDGSITQCASFRREYIEVAAGKSI
jgi:histidine ammonia-lyase